jgi:CubicO group peptidase (beta-lactamase class C family)
MPSCVSGLRLAASSDDLIFADFESGTYDSWTLTGNCWTPEPTTNETFAGKITGFQGRRFLCTLHPRLGNGATGKAVSKEFTIEKPFINFLIGGGDYPEQACLNLIVDGKVVRTKTGYDSAELSRASWDVYEFTGQKAHLEIIDTTQSAQRGYIMLDDIRFSMRPDTPQQVVVESIIRRAMGLRPCPGIVAGISLSGRMVACVASGVRKRGDPTPILLTDPIMIGSISKVLTGAVVAKCVRDGKLSWTDTFEKCVPDIAGEVQHPAKRATLQQFATHTSGLGYAMEESPEHEDISDPVAFRRELITRTLQHIPPAANPGEKREYANLGPDITGTMAERKMGKTFEALIHDVLISDFGLHSLCMGDQGSDMGPPSCPRGHQFTKAGEFVRYGSGRDYADMFWRSALFGGYNLSCLDALHFGGQIATLSVPGHTEYDKQFFDDIYTRRIANSPNTNAGWEESINDVKERTIVHSGNTGRGEWAMLSVYPAGREAIFVYTNMGWETNDFGLAMETYVPMSNWVRRGVLGY